MNSTAEQTEQASNSRLTIHKTYKLFIAGQFPRTESGRHYQIASGESICQGSRKDIREAVVAARSAFPTWSALTAFNRGQILYRIAEMLEGRAEQFIAELKKSGVDTAGARAELDLSIDRLVFYAGFSDKFQSILSSVNPVSASYFNFSILEPVGVVGILSGESAPLLSLVSTLAPVIVSGNTCVIVPSNTAPTPALSFAEVLATSDLPAGVVNLVTGFEKELLPQLASHMDINALLACGLSAESKSSSRLQSVENLKRCVFKDLESWQSAQGIRWISDFCEVKTTWHPIGK